MMSRERQHWLDIVKGIAIILVVMGHVCGIYALDSAYRPFYILDEFIYTFHMPLFLFVSGLLFVTALSKDYRITAMSKLMAYGIPYIVFSIVYWAMKMLGSAFVNNVVNFRDLFLIAVYPLSFMWYLYAILIMMELSLLIARKNIRISLVVSVIMRIVWEVLTIKEGFTDSSLNDLVFTDVMKNYLWFALGLTCAKDLGNVLQRISKQKKISLFLFGLAILVTVSTIGWTRIPFIRILWGMIGIVSIFCIGLMLNENRFLEYLGRNTMQIYLIHGTVISILNIVTTRLRIPCGGGYIPFAYATVIAIAVPLLIYRVCKRIPALDFLFFPNRYLKIK